MRGYLDQWPGIVLFPCYIILSVHLKYTHKTFFSPLSLSIDLVSTTVSPYRAGFSLMPPLKESGKKKQPSPDLFA